MSKNVRLIIGVLVLMGFTSVASVLGYVWLVGGESTPSGTLSAPTLSLDASPDAASAVNTQIARIAGDVSEIKSQVDGLKGTLASSDSANQESLNAVATQVAVIGSSVDGLARLVQHDATQSSLPTNTPTPVPPTVTTAASATPEPTVAAASAGLRAVYRISQEESVVNFTLQEDLQRIRTTVVGTTNQVAGDILVDTANPGASQVGTIRINARTLRTDNEFRNRAIRGEILQSSRDEYEFIDFTPTAITGLPDSITVGESYTFQVTGNLKIRDITNPVTFDVSATLMSETRLEGTAAAAVTRGAYNLIIPNVPGVANVTEEVELRITFVALVVES